ncbi:MAG: hypothetical protein V2A34_03660 [Lentisphaerota bacterium]
MKKTRISMFQRIIILSAALSQLALPCARALEGEDYEEDAGNGFNALINPADDIYGVSIEAGTWLKGTPVFGNLVFSGLYSDPQEAWYGGLGMIFRLMPHWTLAPFVGAGGSYNLSISSKSDDTLSDKGDSFWAGHAEGGARYWFRENRVYMEALFRQTWTSLKYESDFWTAGIGYGIKY